MKNFSIQFIFVRWFYHRFVFLSIVVQFSFGTKLFTMKFELIFPNGIEQTKFIESNGKNLQLKMTVIRSTQQELLEKNISSSFFFFSLRLIPFSFIIEKNSKSICLSSHQMSNNAKTIELKYMSFHCSKQFPLGKSWSIRVQHREIFNFEIQYKSKRFHEILLVQFKIFKINRHGIRICRV